MPLELEQRAAPAHATGAVEFVALEDIAADGAFRLRPEGDVSDLATSLGRLGQLAPVELRPWPGASGDGPRWQVVSGFRRLAAVRLLARERVLARLHAALSDEDAWGLALADALLREPLGEAELQALAERLAASGAAPWAAELLEEARLRAPVAPEERERFLAFLRGEAPAPRPEDQPPSPLSGEEGGAAGRTAGEAPASPAEPEVLEVVEVTPEELAADLGARVAALNQDLASALEAWEDLPAEGKRLLVEQLRWLAAALPFMEAK